MARVEGNGLTSSCNAFWCWDAIKSTRWIMDLKSFAFWLGATGQSALHSAPTFVDGICINMFAPSKHNSDIDLGFVEFKRYDGCLWAFCSKVCNTCADRGPVSESGASVVKAVPSVSLCVSSKLVFQINLKSSFILVGLPFRAYYPFQLCSLWRTTTRSKISYWMPCAWNVPQIA